MSLGVTIIDNTSQKILNENGINYGILLDDTVNVIKEKIFTYTDNFFRETLLYYPNFLKLEIKQLDNSITTIRDTNCLLFYYKSLPENPKIYTTSIFSIFTLTSYHEFSLEIYELYTKMKSDDHIPLYEKLIMEYVDLTLDDFNNLIKMKMYELNKKSEVPILSNNESEILNSDLDALFNNIKTQHDTLKNSYKKETENLKKFYNRVYEIKDYSKFYDIVSKDNVPDFTFTNLTLIVRSEEYDPNVKYIKWFTTKFE